MRCGESSAMSLVSRPTRANVGPLGRLSTTTWVGLSNEIGLCL